MSIADEVIDFVRGYFEEPSASLTPDTDLVTTFNEHDPDRFSHFIEDVSKRFGIRIPELKDIFPDPANPPKGKLRFLLDALIDRQDSEVLFVQQLTVAELTEIVRAGTWPQGYVIPRSQIKTL